MNHSLSIISFSVSPKAPSVTGSRTNKRAAETLIYQTLIDLKDKCENVYYAIIVLSVGIRK